MSTKIEWTDETWNPVSGCSKVSDGCKHCYAERVFPRPYPGRKFTDVQVHENRLDQPLRWKRPRKLFVNSMSDLFHESVSFDFIDKVFAVMALSNQHAFQILTKRPERMWEYFKRPVEKILKVLMDQPLWVELPGGRTFPRWPLEWPLPNVWLGVSVENQTTANERIPLLLETPSAIRFVSYEPALGPVDFRQWLNVMWLVQTPFNAKTGQLGKAKSGYAPTYKINDPSKTPIPPDLDWIIAGGESGHNARPSNPIWFRQARDQCKAAGVPFFFKQWGEWAPLGEYDFDDQEPWCSVYYGEFHQRDDWEDSCMCKDSTETLFRVGKKRAGDLLDGKQHHEFPEVAG